VPLRIAIVTQAYHPAIGGVTEHVDACARVLRERGHHVTIVTAHYGGASDGERDVVRIGRNIVIPYNGAEANVTIGRSLGRRLRGVFEAGAFDVVHVHCPLTPTLPLVALHVTAAPVVGTFHTTLSSDLELRLFRRLLQPFFRRIDRPLAVSATARDCVTRHFPGELEILPNGVDTVRFRPGGRRDPRFDDGVPSILFVGRHDPRKGLPDLLAACRILAREGVEFRLIVVGDGRIRARAERMSSGPLDGRVHFDGRVSNADLPRYYASADVFCSPARDRESFGMVLLEAMASGVPVVASDIPGYRAVVTPGENGLATPPRDPPALARALRTLLLDPERRAALAAGGLRTAQRHAWPRIVARLEEIYLELAGSPGRATAEAELLPAGT
jgi:phosphatidylinositol alpha-mannosyltransferase